MRRGKDWVNPRKMILSEESVKFLKENYKFLGQIRLAEAMGIGKKVVARYAKEFGLNQDRLKFISDLSEARIDMSKFYTMTEPAIAYFLGYLWADGCVRLRFNRKYSPTVKMSLTKDDFDDIEWVIDDVGIFPKTSRVHNGGRPERGIQTCHNGLFEFLKNLGYCEKSGGSLKSVLEAIPDKLFRFFLRGLIDGDGCIFIRKEGCKGEAFAIYISSSISQNWEALLEEIKIKIGEDMKIEYIRSYSGQSSRLHAGSTAAENILDFVYSSYDEDGIGLKRKFEKYKCIKQIMDKRRSKNK